MTAVGLSGCLAVSVPTVCSCQRFIRRHSALVGPDDRDVHSQVQVARGSCGAAGHVIAVRRQFGSG